MSYQIVHLQDFELQLCKRASDTHSSPHQTGTKKPSGAIPEHKPSFSPTRYFTVTVIRQIISGRAHNLMQFCMFALLPKWPLFIEIITLLPAKPDNFRSRINLFLVTRSASMLTEASYSWSTLTMKWMQTQQVVQNADVIVSISAGSSRKRDSCYDWVTTKWQTDRQETIKTDTVEHMSSNSTILLLQMSAHCESGILHVVSYTLSLFISTYRQRKHNTRINVQWDWFVQYLEINLKICNQW